MVKDITILLTGAGAPGAPGIIKCFRSVKERGIRIVGVDMNPFPSGRALVDVFYTVPPASSDDFIPAILDICLREKVDVVIPIVTRELMKFAEAKSQFKNYGILISVLDKDILDIVNDKLHLLDALTAHGIQTPQYRVIKDVSELRQACEELGYPDKPVCVKQTQGNGSRGIRFIDKSKSRYDLFINEKPNSMYISYEEMELTLKERRDIPRFLVMEFLPGQEYSVDLLTQTGRTIFSVGRYNSKVISSIPVECTLDYRKDVIDISEAISSAMGLTGNIGLDFRYDVDNKPQIMEINPRLTATIVTPAAAGINLPYLGIKLLLGEPFEVHDIDYDGVKMVRRWEEEFFDINGNKIAF